MDMEIKRAEQSPKVAEGARGRAKNSKEKCGRQLGDSTCDREAAVETQMVDVIELWVNDSLSLCNKWAAIPCLLHQQNYQIGDGVWQRRLPSETRHITPAPPIPIPSVKHSFVPETAFYI
ncbi:hypothetical protein GOBAR_AA34278 [Gossypium barbadense]|uniref:Uncharacterized protein n=1 Tax=Gossypium barbadense TaxID=3634 RepID=A0A2P5W5M5_GOSBA|nr:hypothetical protein GOBAR_AA34278 [Gossypium barbadense]